MADTRVLRFACVLLLLTGAAAPALAGFSGTDVFLPSVGRTAGVPPSQWYTTVWVHNPNATAVNVSFSLLERDVANTSPRVFNDTIPPGDTRRYVDAVWTMFGVEAVGALRVLASERLLVNSRIYSQLGVEVRDSAGQFFAAVPASFAIGLGRQTELLGVHQTLPADESDFRYNFGFVEVTGSPVTLRVTLADETGAIVDSRDYSLRGHEPRQFQLRHAFAGASLDNGLLTVEVVAGDGRVIVFGSGVANGSQDPSTYEMAFDDELLATGGGGTITGVTAGGGLTGGGDEGSVTLHVGAGDGIAVTADAVAVALGGVDAAMLSAEGSAAGQLLTSEGATVGWQDAAGLALPFQGSTQVDSGPGFSVDNTGVEGFGVAGLGDRAGVFGSGGEFGVYGQGTASIGVYGKSDSGDGVQGESQEAAGVRGLATAPDQAGVWGENPEGWGVVGSSSSDDGFGVGGFNDSAEGFGVAGWNFVADNAGFLGGPDFGVWGAANVGFAGDFTGDVRITDDLEVGGTISKGGGAFRIDHPLDPENRILSHSFVESPDMMNVYNGNVVLGAGGEAWVELPEWFEALNRDFRYQLTCIGGFAPVFVAEEFRDGRFRIAGGPPGQKVSWQVTGIRHDPWAEANRIRVEEDKAPGDRGGYLHPQAYGLPAGKAIGARTHSRGVPAAPAPGGR